MEKILGLILGLVYAFWFVSVSSDQVQQTALVTNVVEASTVEQHSINQELSQNDIHETIKRVGDEQGWIMTEFKNNTLIAEKIGDKETISVTVKFSKYNFDISPLNSELSSAITSALNI